MKFNVRTFVNSFVIYLITAILSMILLNVLGNTVLWTVANAIFGNEKVGAAATTIFIRIAWGVLILIVVWIFKTRTSKSKDLRKKYLADHENKEYSRKDDLKEILRSADCISECCAMLAASLAFTVFYFNPIFLVIVIPFVPFNLFLHSHIHKSWTLSRKEYE